MLTSKAIPRLSATATVPAKLNLFLHVTGQRSDGYHLLESVFVAIDWYDALQIEVDDSGAIDRQGDLGWPYASDLAVRAAQALRAQALKEGRLSEAAGCRITLKKSIPHGAGLGGGSADAAYTLRLLNRLWGLHYETKDLAQIGLSLGADVPFFLGPGCAHVRGIGEDIVAYPVMANAFVVVVPAIEVPTATIFRDPGLRRDTPGLDPAALQTAACASIWTLGHNDLEPVACRQFPAITALITALQACAADLGIPAQACRMSGSGSALFASCADANQARALASRLQAQTTALHGQNSGITIRVCQKHFEVLPQKRYDIAV